MWTSELIRQVSLLLGGEGVSGEGARTPVCVAVGMRVFRSVAEEWSCEGQVAKGMESVMM